MASMVKRRSDDAFFKPPRQYPERSPGGFPVGKRTLKREASNRRLSKLKIRECEIRIQGRCVRFIQLTWAHSKKSRFLVTKADWDEAARCCLPCHDYIEILPHREMHKLVTEAIERRKQQPTGDNNGC